MLLSLQGTFPSAILALADGTVFVGNSIGASGSTVGEVVFNTSLTGYQEILTDPSYCQQIVTLTYPHIGNYGVNPEDVESDKVHAAGLIIKDLPIVASNFRSTETLSAYLSRSGTVAIANIDTRQLTRLLRSKGARPNASRPAATPRRMPTPPTRGTALWWNFCGPEKSWSSARGCFLATRSTSRLTTTETAKATNASTMWVVPDFCKAADDKGRARKPEPEFRPGEEVKARALQARVGVG